MHDIAHAAADAARVPDFDDVLANGRRQRTRRQGVAGGAAAVAVAVILGVTQVVGGGDAGPPEPSPSPDVPTGSDPTNIPYWVDGTLHVGDVEISTDLRPGLYAAGTAFVGQGDKDGGEMYLLHGDELVPFVESDRMLHSTISRDGRLVVTLDYAPGGSQRLTAWDVDSRSEIASVSLPIQEEADQYLVVGIDQDHRVFVSNDRASALMWVPGQDPIPVTGVSPSALDAEPWPGGLSYSRVRGGSGIGVSLGDVFGTVDDRGRFHEVGRLPALGPGSWSPTGEVYVTSLPTETTNGLDRKALTLEYADGREPEVIELPDDELWLPVAWESDTQLVLAVSGNQVDANVNPPVDELARCDVIALTCTEIDEVPDGGIYWPSDAGGRW